MSIDQSDAPRPRWRINFEISVRRQRRWEVFGTYSAAEREVALAEAKKLEKDGSDGAKVTKETYNLSTGQVETSVIYRSPALEKEMIELAADRPRPAAAPPPAKPEKAPARSSKPTARVPQSAPAKPSSDADDTLLRALPWILIALVVASLFGGALTVGASYSLQYAVAKGAVMTDQTRIAALVGVFVIVTGTVLFAQLRRIMRRFGLARSVNRGAAHESAPPPPVDDRGTDDAAAVAAPLASAAAKPAPALPPLAVQQANAFEAAVSAGLAASLGSLDTGQRFAVNVYIGGAMDHLAGSHDLDSHGCRDLFTATLLRFGTPPEIASRLPDLLEGYLGQAKVRALYEAGAAHMAGHLAGRPIDIADCLTDWDAVKVDDAGPDDQVVAILVTEIVQPDAAGKSAQRRRRAHDHLVRRAVAACGGVEIKPTDDGIMASFATPAAAVNAATQIVDAVVCHAAEHPDLSFGVRAGIDAGTVVRDGDDLFGATVQLANRLCGGCAADEILVSRAMRDLCGDSYEFRQLEDMSLRGFPEPVSVCRVIPAGDQAGQPSTGARGG